jgi:hypothetical protein
LGSSTNQTAGICPNQLNELSLKGKVLIRIKVKSRIRILIRIRDKIQEPLRLKMYLAKEGRAVLWTDPVGSKTFSRIRIREKSIQMRNQFETKIILKN